MFQLKEAFVKLNLIVLTLQKEFLILGLGENEGNI